jgi:hypothetical protein
LLFKKHFTFFVLVILALNGLALIATTALPVSGTVNQQKLTLTQDYTGEPTATPSPTPSPIPTPLPTAKFTPGSPLTLGGSSTFAESLAQLDLMQIAEIILVALGIMWGVVVIVYVAKDWNKKSS